MFYLRSLPYLLDYHCLSQLCSAQRAISTFQQALNASARGISPISRFAAVVRPASVALAFSLYAFSPSPLSSRFRRFLLGSLFQTAIRVLCLSRGAYSFFMACLRAPGSTIQSVRALICGNTFCATSSFLVLPPLFGRRLCSRSAIQPSSCSPRAAFDDLPPRSFHHHGWYNLYKNWDTFGDTVIMKAHTCPAATTMTTRRSTSLSGLTT